MSFHRHRLQLAALAAAIACVPACSWRPQLGAGLLTPYRIDLPQGNYVTSEMLDQVRPGQSREQVRALLGTPLLEDLFHDDRWDYVYLYKFANGNVELRRARVTFKDGRVADTSADALPAREDTHDPGLPGARPAQSPTQGSRR